ncbi:T9SS type A sorting domain-containing protein [Hymenobacter sp. GOD-10R]|uniref:T9SS type A sorting domain-containing protein n=1 Tax=Hymenobacter sp. GOD-10R TaxID=3093922 RepID=UPI002D78C205|nr:T9SS type A sorting domain-containing protein [Hymenobacter sp. GOD-10R]WRQ26535.1 T9SS type A sorting domain-containing protein [Hymenobacter sp. GOD-10R]
MKKPLLLVAGFVLSSFAAQAQWVLQPFTFPDVYQAAYNIDAVDANVVWVSSNDLIEGTANQYGRTSNGGTSWTTGAISNLTSAETITGIAGINATTAVVCVTTGTTGRILKTVNGGTTWTAQTSATQFAGPSSFPNFVSFFSATEGICVGDPPTGTAFEIYTTADAGTTWTRVPTANVPAAQAGETGIVKNFASIGNSCWFATTNGRVYYSSNKGQTWGVSNSGLNTNGDLAFTSALNGIMVTGEFGGSAHTMSRTTNGGVTWTPTTFTGTLHGEVSGVPGTNEILSVGFADDYGSSYSRNGGLTWTSLESTRDHISLDVVSPTVAWSGALDINNVAGLGVYKLNSTVLGNSHDVALQSGLSVYPNPSTGGQFTLKLGSGLTKAAQVHVFDAMGRVVYTRAVEAANPTVTLDLAQQAAGVYTLRVSAEGGVAQQKLVVK